MLTVAPDLIPTLGGTPKITRIVETADMPGMTEKLIKDMIVVFERMYMYVHVNFNHNGHYSFECTVSLDQIDQILKYSDVVSEIVVTKTPILPEKLPRYRHGFRVQSVFRINFSVTPAHTYYRSDFLYKPFNGFKKPETKIHQELGKKRVMGNHFDEKLLDDQQRFSQLFGVKLVTWRRCYRMCHSCEYASLYATRCSRCHTIYYCGEECQSNDWPDHRRKCRALAKLRAKNKEIK